MNNFVELMSLLEANRLCAMRLGRKLIAYGFGVTAMPGVIATVMVILMGAGSAAAQTPSGSFFNGNSGQLGNSLRPITFFLAAAMIIAGITFVAVGSLLPACGNRCLRGSSRNC